MKKKAGCSHWAALALMVLLAGQAVSQDVSDSEARGPHHVPSVESRVRIDGVLDEEVWDDALKLELRYEVNPGENIPAHVRSEVLMAYDRTHLYIAFRCYDPQPAAIRAHLTDRDSAWNDDRVVAVLDTFNDERRAFNFCVNPVGVQMDYAGPNGSEDIGWDAIWDSAGRITAWGWVAEMAIPFSSISFQRGDGAQTWGFVAARHYPRSHQYWFNIVPDDRNNNCTLCQAAKIEGFEGITSGRNVEINPTLTAVRSEERSSFPDGDFETRDQEADVGLTANWGMTPNLTLSATVNPDFSQVEADALQLDINEPFALFFPERRPFFTEGSDFFATRLNIVHTRTMRSPTWGVKLAGKEGANTFGAYVVRDELTNLIFPGSQSSSSTSLAMASTASVFRYRRDIGNRYTVGLLATDREGDDYFNRLLGFDGEFRLTNRDRVSVQFLGSSTSYPDEVATCYGQPQGRFNDRALDIFYVHSTRSLSWWGGYRDIGRGFRADLGYMPQVDLQNFNAGLGYNWIAKPGEWWSSVNINGGYNLYRDQNGELLRELINVYMNYNGALQSSFSPVISRTREVYNGVEFDLNSVSLSGGFWPNGNTRLWAGATFGDHIDYANTRPGKMLRLLTQMNFNLGLHLRFSFNHTFERLTVDSGRLYTANISQATAIYQFNTRTFFRSIVQYVDYNYSSELYTFDIDSEYKRLFTQLLFSYKINPRTVLFIGYSDNYFGTQEFSITQAQRTFFAKIGYAWQL